ncbi:putative enoyl-CoA hydratase echA8 [Clostridium homopropionicum DSM 5847]|uniref:short-chain-enoyl-CoA hydratase n=1 Tax=Clostridium homopropionicum DSM 5847 TaxID=1121318 RepID=A0A0L6Z5S0_9CLOT|nr:short-chain-enoyl-CoA hydratase [Clostridium homopropionicum]KOA18307.1 putative enoyl-CoA hydratase echA8 [Clostridium homopropionicum DSM 5847]SFF69410.1 enoyl-CoA hydratase [Clostridium homopropionicum]
MELKNVLLQKEGNVALVTINRPKALNALNSETLKELDIVIDEIANSNDIFAVVLTGAGEKAFVAGADISEMKEMNVLQGRNFAILGNKVFRKLETLEIPVIAAINGFALGGGCELSMACDIRIASEKAKFGQPEVGLGITPGFGGTQRLARLVGMGMAKEIIYSTRLIDAQKALQIGLVNSVVAPEALLDEAKKLAGEIASKAPVAVKLSKQAINRGMQVDMDTAIMIEAEVFGECFSTEDQTDAMTAFVEKRKLEGFKNR